MRLDTFQSPEQGLLAVHDEDTIRWRASVDRTPTIQVDPEALTNKVAALTVTADMHPSQIPAPADFEAVVLATVGAGHIPPGIIDPLEDLAQEDVPLVATTRCPEGRLATSTYDYRGSEKTLRNLGCYYSDQNLQKVRVEVIVGLSGDSLNEVLYRP
jgi:L-asparaginase